MERYREAACQSNLRQITTAAFSYAADKGEIPDAGDWVQPIQYGQYSWTLWTVTNGTLFAYMNDPQPYRCSTFYLMERDLPVSLTTGPTASRSYTMNTRENYGVRANVIPLFGMRAPANKVFFSEENIFAPTYVGGNRMNDAPMNDGALCGANGWDCTATFHRFSSCMASFLDGHTARFIMDKDYHWRTYFWKE